MVDNKKGINESEKYLNTLCRSTFLSLWSYPNTFKKRGKELTDLLIVVGDDVIIFSDKHCIYPESDNDDLNWNRWFRRAVSDSAKQLWQAERWIMSYPDKIFLDPKCENMLPIPISLAGNTRFHLVLVAHGASVTCKKVFNGSPSLMFHNTIKGFENHKQPFVIGELDDSETFVHVLDDHSLDLVLKNLDTVLDFTAYLTKRAIFLRSEGAILSPGEEELLALYLSNLNSVDEHDFVIKGFNAKNILQLSEGSWEHFQSQPERENQLKADRESYMWDELIERFSHNAVSGTFVFGNKHTLSDVEKAIRMMAIESRFSRRILAKTFINMLKETPSQNRSLNILKSFHYNTYFVFLLFPFPDKREGISLEDYRSMRGHFMEASCLVTKLIRPDADHVVGISMESGLAHPSGEDLIYFDCSVWNEDMEKLARKYQSDYKILVSIKEVRQSHKEYPNK